MPFVSDFTNTNSTPNVFLREAQPPEVVIGASIGVVGCVTQAIRGPVGVPTLISSLSDFVRKFGGYDAAQLGEGYMFAENLFKNGATNVKVVRVTDGNELAATATVNGTTYRVNSPGTWGNSVTLTVVSGTVAGYVNLTFSYGVESYTYAGVTFTNPADERYVGTVLQNSTDDFVSIVTQGSLNPAAGTYVFSGGRNGLVQGSSLLDSAFVGTNGTNGLTGLVALEADGDVELIVCSRGSVVVAQALNTHCNLSYVSPRLGIATFASGLTVAGVVSNMAVFNSDKVVVVYPWLQILNANNNKKEIHNPTSFVAGLISTLSYHTSVTRRQLIGAIGTERALTPAESDTLFNNRVMSLVVKFGGIICENNLNTSGNPGKRQITRRRAVNFFAKTFESAAQRFVGQNHTPELRNDVVSSFSGLCSAEERARKIGNSATGGTAFKVVCDSSNNPIETVRQNKLIVDVQISLWNNADYILVTVDATEAKVIA